MPAAGKLRGQPFIHDAKSFTSIEDAGAESEHVGIVVFAAHLGLIFRAHVGGPDPVNLVGGNRHANAAAADQDSEIGALLAYIMGHRAGVIRVVNRFRRGCAFIADLYALLLKVLLDLVFQLVTGVVGAHCDFHEFILLKACWKVSANRNAGHMAGTGENGAYFLPSCFSPASMPSFTW